MCYYVEQKSSRADAKIRFNIAVNNTGQFYEGMFVNGFSYPNLPIITNESPDIITTDHTWGLLPSWTKDIDFRKNTLNARIETINEKPSYKNITQNRCLIIATGFYEWRWLDDKGKSKEKYHISSQTDEIFCFAGLYDKWVNRATGEVLKTYTMVTTEANELMQYIHNHKRRMPVILNREDENAWLDKSNNITDFALPYQTKLIAFPTK
jgi:putative SOS response-associated peptidase YedK